MQSAKPPFRRSSSRSRPCDATRALLGARHPPDTTKAGRQPGFDAKRGRTALKFIQPETPWGLAAAIVATRRARVNGEPLDERKPFMRKRHSAVPHRLGRRTNFIPSLEGHPAKWAEVVDVAGDAAERAKAASVATATLLTIDVTGSPRVATADVNSLMSMVPDQLLPVRRPASHKGMKNYISRVVVPTEAHECRAVWCESFNELTHLRDLLISRQPTQVATQPFRLEWIMTTGVRGHVPDFLLRDADGRALLVDVTTRTKLDDPRLKAVLQLTAATAEALGWEYQVRTELPAQRVRNLNFLHAGRHDTDQDRVGAARVLRQTPGSIDVQRASDLLGGGPQGFVRLWDLIAHGHVQINIDSVIERDSTVAFQASGGGASWLHAM